MGFASLLLRLLWRFLSVSFSVDARVTSFYHIAAGWAARACACGSCGLTAPNLALWLPYKLSWGRWRGAWAKPALSCLCLSRLAFDFKVTSKARNSVFVLIENSASPAAVVDCFIGICLSACKGTDIISPGARVGGTIWRTWPVPWPWRDILTFLHHPSLCSGESGLVLLIMGTRNRNLEKYSSRWRRPLILHPLPQTVPPFVRCAFPSMMILCGGPGFADGRLWITYKLQPNL